MILHTWHIVVYTKYVMYIIVLHTVTDDVEILPNLVINGTCVPWLQGRTKGDFQGFQKTLLHVIGSANKR